ncbi:hypothetical protein H257_00425 [Aphanomyces astaci]|uniref:Uncharacterized protein n=1 Tax=Aphanomyces astaci TaxID=112090 RepID=W4HBS0_APHAT|nr:hypothetical protein H257_00425 [Aphanomyces astaci]ETV89021.1 hypothetical protein H257_00425 [Aphanomyces astaci]|eukprot:XP_009821421.1 hypothetical protein H257_00425 [Aphanomyces astaci]
MSGLHDKNRAAYPFDADCSSRLAALTDPVSPKPRRASSCLHRFALADGLLMFQPTADSPPHIVMPGDAQLQTLGKTIAKALLTTGHTKLEKWGPAVETS